jgi:hypothetical protein
MSGCALDSAQFQLPPVAEDKAVHVLFHAHLYFTQHVALLQFGLTQLPCAPIELAFPILNSISIIKQDMDAAARRDFLKGTREPLVLRLKPYHDTFTNDWDSPALLRWWQQ